MLSVLTTMKKMWKGWQKGGQERWQNEKKFMFWCWFCASNVGSNV